MSVEYRWVMTAAGLAKRAAAEAGGALLAPAQFAVGDGNGVDHEPEELLGGLVHEVWRGAINRVYVHPLDNTLVVIEAKIPVDQGGWDIREAAIFDTAGTLILVGKYPLTTKPAPGSGGEKEIVIRGGVRVSNGGDFVLQIDSSLVMATQEYVDDHAALTNPHQATSAATASRLMLRDAAGRVKVAAPGAVDDVARLAEVNAAQATVEGELAAHTARQDNPHAVTAAQTGAAVAGHNHDASYIKLSLATAVSDFLVASGAGAWVKKTLVEVKAILGLGGAAYLNTGTAVNTVAIGNHGHANDANIGGPYQASATAINTGNFAGTLNGYFGNSMAAAGYQRLPGGMILQWGPVSTVLGALTAYPIAFPTATLKVFLQRGVGPGGQLASGEEPYIGAGQSTYQNPTNSGFYSGLQSTSAQPITFFAIGY